MWGRAACLPRQVGSAAALEQGDGKKALDFFQKVLQFDPDQADVRKQYKDLKAVLKLLSEAEEQLTKGGTLNQRAVGTHTAVAQPMIHICQAIQ